MRASHVLAADARPTRPFATGAYVLVPGADGGGGLLPRVLPTCCPGVDGAVPSVCQLRVHHHRDRKTGPCIPLVVLSCGRHRRAFTFYPLGHRPYGRVAMAPVSLDGEPLGCEATPDDVEEAAAPGRLRLLAWGATLFAAALDAGAGKAWPREAGEAPGQWETQLRWITEGAALLGVAPLSPDSTVATRDEKVALHLEVPQLTLISSGRSFEQARGFRARGEILLSVLARLRPDRCLVDRLLATGALCGCWGAVERWDPSAAGPRRVVFPAGRTIGM